MHVPQSLLAYLKRLHEYLLALGGVHTRDELITKRVINRNSKRMIRREVIAQVPQRLLIILNAPIYLLFDAIILNQYTEGFNRIGVFLWNAPN